MDRFRGARGYGRQLALAEHEVAVVEREGGEVGADQRQADGAGEPAVARLPQTGECDPAEDCDQHGGQQVSTGA